MVGLKLFSGYTKDIRKDLASQVTTKVLGTSWNIFLPCIPSTVLFLAMFCIPQTEFMCHVYNVFMLSHAKPQILPFARHWTPWQWPGSAETWEVYWKVVGVNSYNCNTFKSFHIICYKVSKTAISWNWSLKDGIHHILLKVKVKVTLEQSMTAQRGNRG
jgi:hypothetical protein